jgi:hypothetical protein
MLFNIYDLCPTNAPKLCEWCHGPYHIRKRCPKLAALSNERQKKKRGINQQWDMNGYYTSTSNYYQDNSNWYSNKNHGYNYPKSAPPNQQQQLRYTTQDGSREFHNTNYYPNENNSQHRNQIRKCFNCGSPDHIKAKCPESKKTAPVQQPKSSS